MEQHDFQGKTEFKKIASVIVVSIGAIIFLIGLFVLLWVLAYTNAPASYGGPSKISDYVMAASIMGFGFLVIISPAWVGSIRNINKKKPLNLSRLGLVCFLVIAGISVLLGTQAANRGKMLSKAIGRGVWVNMNIYSAPNAQPISAGSSFAILKNESPEDAQFEQEIIQKISKLLVLKGHKINDPEAADYLLRFTYGIESGSNVWEATWLKLPNSKPAAGSFSHVFKKSPHPYLAEFSASIVEKNTFERIKDMGRPEFTHSSIWFTQAYSKMVAMNYKEALDYVMVGTLKRIGQRPESSNAIKVEENDMELGVVRSN